VRALPCAIKFLLPLAAALLTGACASFHSGDILVERGTLRDLLDDRNVTPFSKIQLSWQNYPFTNPTDSIGEGSVSNPKKIVPVTVPAEDLDYLRREARKILAEAGLYSAQTGSGTLKISLTTFGRWKYRDLFRSYLADTAFIFILPSTIRVNYSMTAEFASYGGPLKTEVSACEKTTFHLFMAPLYPFLSPGARGKSLLRQMLWRTSTEIYEKIKDGRNSAKTGPEPAPSTDAGQAEQKSPLPPGPVPQISDTAEPQNEALDD